jgi:hypothetical protein
MQRELVERAMAGDHDAFSELARVVGAAPPRGAISEGSTAG